MPGEWPGLLGTLRTWASHNTLRLRVVSVFLSFVLVALAFALSSPNFRSLQNLKVIAFNASLIAIVACAEAVVVTTRNLDVSVGSIIGLAGYVTAQFAAGHPDAGPLIVLVAVAIGLTLGVVNGAVVAYGQVPSIVATLGTLAIFRGVTFILGRDWEMTALAAVVLGGVSMTGGSGNVVGVLFAALILSTIDNGLVLASAPEFWRMFIQGVAIVGAIALDAGIERRIQALFRHRAVTP
jgi:rhamnose transport system permease protein